MRIVVLLGLVILTVACSSVREDRAHQMQGREPDGTPGPCAQAIAAGDNFTCVVTTTGGVRCWGADAAPTGRTDCMCLDECCGTPSTSDALTGVRSMSTLPGQGQDGHVCALTATGGVRCWGYNTYGQLGDGTTTGRGTPPDTDVLADVQAIAVGGAFTCALTTAGGVRCWGNNWAGQLGDGTHTHRSTPPDTDVLAGVQAITAGAAHICALMNSGGVRCWGHNYRGQLGDGTTTSRMTPPDTDVLADVQSIVATDEETCAVTTTGGLRCWGGGSSLQSVPPSTDMLTDVRRIAMAPSHTCALMGSGGVRCWGDNGYGELGDGTVSVSPNPPETDIFTDALAIAVGDGHTCALSAGGGVSCWGRDDYGQLGDVLSYGQRGTPEYCAPAASTKSSMCRKNPTPVQGICNKASP
jgi:alpha-tubulin suppressor-like RCC1 family protein